MSGPRTKRPYAGSTSIADPSQRSITTFLHISEGDKPRTTHLQETTKAQTPPTSYPELPAHVQANLLSVGMRVRKSVPEGYKTHCTSPFPLAADPFPSVPRESSTLFPGSQQQQVYHEVEEPLPSPPRHRPRRGAMVVLPSEPRPMSPAIAIETASRTAAPRELVPYCGLHHIGGLSVQPMPSGSEHPYEQHYQLPGSPPSSFSSESDSALLDDSDFAIAADDGGNDAPPPLHAVPSLMPSASQESTSSTDSVDSSRVDSALWWRNLNTIVSESSSGHRPQGSRKRPHRDGDEDEEMTLGSGGFRMPAAMRNQCFDIYTTTAAAGTTGPTSMEDGDVSPRTLGPSRGAPWDGGSASGGVAVFGDATIASHLQNRILAVPRGTRQNQLHRHRSKELGAKEGSSHFLGGPPSPSSAGAATVWEKRKLVHEEVGQENVVVIGNMSDDLDLAMDGMESAAARGSMLAASTGGGAAMDDDFAEATFLDYPAFGSAAGEDMEMGDV